MKTVKVTGYAGFSLGIFSDIPIGYCIMTNDSYKLIRWLSKQKLRNMYSGIYIMMLYKIQKLICFNFY